MHLHQMRCGICRVVLSSHIGRQERSERVVLDEQTLSLGQIFDLKVGSQLKLKATPSSAVDITCGSIPVFRGVMGRKDENIAIKISEKLIKEVE